MFFFNFLIGTKKKVKNNIYGYYCFMLIENWFFLSRYKLKNIQ